MGLFRERPSETVPLSATTPWVLVPPSVQLAQLGMGVPWKQWCALGGMASVHGVGLLYTRLRAVYAFVFIVSRIFFLPCRLPLL